MNGQTSDATLLANHVEHGQQVEFWRGNDGKPYATVHLNGHREVHGVQSREFKSILRDWARDILFKLPSRGTINGVCEYFAGLALRGHPRELYLRVAGYQGRIYVDLCDSKWRVIEIGPRKWKVVEDPPVSFKRGTGMLALPLPEANGSIEPLRKFINLPDNEYKLFVGFLLTAFNPWADYPVMHLLGEQGTGKSTMTRMVRMLLDPNWVALREPPRGRKQTAVSASHAWLMTYENMSKLDTSRSDELARLATGGGVSVRTLFTDDEERLFKARRPIVINGIEEISTRSDLLSRMLILRPQYIAPMEYDPRILEQFEAAVPIILGGLFGALSTALRNRSKVELPEITRMGEFCYWSTAAETGDRLGWKKGGIMKAYFQNRDEIRAMLLDNDPVIKHLIHHMSWSGGEWEGSASELLLLLREIAGGAARFPNFPNSNEKMGKWLSRMKADLRQIGIHTSKGYKGNGRAWRIVMDDPGESGTLFSAMGRHLSDPEE